jgi:hypothetical protein
MNPDGSKFCQKCGTPAAPKANAQNISAPNVFTPQTPYIPPQNNAYAPPPVSGYPPQNSGFRPQSGGYVPPNAGYGPGNPYPTYPRKNKNPAVMAAGILTGLAVVIAAVVLLATMKPTRGGNTEVSGEPSDNIILGNNSPDPSGTPDDGFRDNYTQLLGGGADEVTVMIYVCGADLESDGANGTMDINEMLAAD